MHLKLNVSLLIFFFHFGICQCQSSEVLDTSNRIKNNLQKFVWYPYWNSESAKYSPFTLFNTLVFFAYDINESTGECYDSDAISQWRNTTIIDSVKKYHNKVLLCITSYDSVRNELFLNKPAAWKTLADSLKTLLTCRNADGIDIDFWDIPTKEREKFVEFLKFLRAELGSSYLFTQHVYYEDIVKNSLLFIELKSVVNTWVLSGFSVDNSRLEPLARLSDKEKNDRSLENMLQLCIEQGLSAENCVLCLPLFGSAYFKSNSEKLISTDMPYSEIILMNVSPNYYKVDSISQSTQIFILDKRSHLNLQYDVIEFESSQNLDTKFTWARRRVLGGIGLWGLGYDEGRTELWQVFSK